MRRKILCTVLILALANASDWRHGLSRTWADDETPAIPPTRIALLDLARIFQNYAKFKQQSEVLRQDVERAERRLATKKAELKTAADEFAALPKGSSEAKKVERQIARDQAEVTAQVTEQKRDFYEREAAMYYESYKEIMAEVDRYAKARSINLVMRFNGDPYDPNDSQSLQKELNKAVLYHQGIDITDDILHLVNSKAAEENVATSTKKSDEKQTR